MKYAGTACELGGMAVASFGLYQLAPWLGVLAAGIALAIIGQALGGER